MLPAQTAQRHFLIAVPTFGMLSKEFFSSLHAVNRPMNTSLSIYFPEDLKDKSRRWLPVDEARNLSVKYALENGYEYIYFRDDDVVDLNPNTMMQLMGRKVDIIAGVYCSKSIPPEPLILGFGNALPKTFGGYTDWTKGDIFKADAVGMGNCLIRTEIFRHIPEPWFRTTTRQELDDEIGRLGDTLTEDVYFCLKARRYGFDIWVDTGSQSFHQDFVNARYYCYDDSKGLYGYVQQTTGEFVWNPTGAEIEANQKARAERTKGSRIVRFDLGAGWRREGYITVDMEGDCDEKGDFTNLDWLINKYGPADEIYSNHALEHIPFPQAPRVLRTWLKALKPGGKLEVGVPDLEWCVRNWLELPENHPEKHGFEKAKIFGLQTSPGQEHKGGFTLPQLEALCKQMPFESVKIEQEFDPKKQNQPTIWIRGIKLKGEKKDPKIYLEGTKQGNNGDDPEKAEELVDAVMEPQTR